MPSILGRSLSRKQSEKSNAAMASPVFPYMDGETGHPENQGEGVSSLLTQRPMAPKMAGLCCLLSITECLSEQCRFLHESL